MGEERGVARGDVFGRFRFWDSFINYFSEELELIVESGEWADAAVHFRGEEGGERDSLLSPLDMSAVGVPNVWLPFLMQISVD